VLRPQASSVEDAIVFVVVGDLDVRHALSSLFESIGLSVRAFASATEMLLRELPSVPSCLVPDIRLPKLSGLDLQLELSAKGIVIPIVFMTAHGDIPMSVQAMRVSPAVSTGTSISAFRSVVSESRRP
jgi:FixJ family two-component response regulator